MKRLPLALSALALLAAPLACSKADDKDSSKADADKDKDKDKDGGEGGKKGDKANAAGDAVAEGDAVTECPKSLEGKEQVSRVIKKECGEVPVLGEYSTEGTLTLEAGARLAFEDGGSLKVGIWEPAKLIVKGTPEDPVVLTSKGDKVAGVWNGVVLGNKAARSKIDNLVIEFAGAGESPSLEVTAPDVTIDGLTVRDAKSVAVRVDDQLGFSLTKAKFERGPERIIDIHPNAVAGLGAGSYDANMKIRVQDGRVEREGTWQDHGAPLLFTGEVEVAGKDGAMTKLTIAAGSELRFDSEGRISVGRWEPAKLILAGTDAAPIRLTNLADAAGSTWTAVAVESKGELEATSAQFAFAGKDETGAIRLVNEGKLTAKSCKFSDAPHGIVAADAESTLSVEGSSFERVAVPYKIHPQLMGGLLAGNSYAPEAAAQVSEGKINKDATWTLQGLPFVFSGELNLEKAKLTIPAGFVGKFERGASVVIGRWEESELTAVGTPDAPIRLEGVVDEASVWGPISFEGKTTKATLTNVKFRNTGGESAVKVLRDATVALDQVTGAKVDVAIVTSECGSKLTATNLVAEEGTPKTAIDPSGC